MEFKYNMKITPEITMRLMLGLTVLVKHLDWLAL